MWSWTVIILCIILVIRFQISVLQNQTTLFKFNKTSADQNQDSHQLECDQNRKDAVKHSTQNNETLFLAHDLISFTKPNNQTRSKRYQKWNRQDPLLVAHTRGWIIGVEMNMSLELFTWIMRAQIAIRSLLSNLVLICGHCQFSTLMRLEEIL